MGFGVWGLGFGVWGLGFRVSGVADERPPSRRLRRNGSISERSSRPLGGAGGLRHVEKVASLLRTMGVVPNEDAPPPPPPHTHRLTDKQTPFFMGVRVSQKG